MKPLRQIEAAELMISGKNYTVSFAAAIFGVTSEEQLVKPSKSPSAASNSECSSLLEETTGNIVDQLAVARRTYGADVLALTVICRSVEKLIQNEEVIKYLQHNHPGILGELQDLVSDVNAERAITQ
jgi:hypothetical protein